MTGPITSYVFAHSQAKGAARLLLLALAHLADTGRDLLDDGPSHRELAALARIDPSTVPRALRTLAEGSELETEHGQRRTRYRITVGPSR